MTARAKCEAVARFRWERVATGEKNEKEMRIVRNMNPPVCQ
jgi:hypothetical protein